MEVSRMKDTIMQGHETCTTKEDGIPRDYRGGLKNILEKEVRAMVNEEIKKGTQELLEEQRKAIRLMVEESKIAIQQIVDEEKTAIWANMDEMRKSITMAF